MRTFICNIILSSILLFFLLTSCSTQRVEIVHSPDASPQKIYGINRLSEKLTEAGYAVSLSDKITSENINTVIVVGEWDDLLTNEAMVQHNIPNVDKPGKEGFAIQSTGKIYIIRGSDANGSLYGCLELATLINETGKLPETIDLTDQPQMVMRGTCIGLQKTEFLPGREVYEYPITPENFPWFYDKEQWVEYLDMMVENRFNSLYLWNGHPFASLVKLDDYPYAVEVTDEEFALNEEMYNFITIEAEKRGIWVIQMFYNIIVSKPFAEYHGIRTQDRSRGIMPVISDYTRKSIAAFIEKYPHVGLLVTLGEAMSGIDNDIEWFTGTIIPGVKDGLAALGRTDEPPIVLRGHDTNPKAVMEVAMKQYSNLYTVHKYNGESLTTYEPRDSWASTHQGLSAIGTVHISNVHILANLEPFRYGSPDFIQKSVQAMHEIQGANGLHLYPQTSYWDWPFTADNTTPRLKQTFRDWIWYRAWGRYAWQYDRDRKAELEYWTTQMDNFYGTGKDGKYIIDAYEETGEIAPKLLRAFGISDGNRQTLLLGMFMAQLVNPFKYHVYESFLTSSGPEKEILTKWAEKEWNGQPHHGETPPQIIEETLNHAKAAVAAIDKAANHVKANKEEFKRLRNDVYCYEAFTYSFSEKVKAAMLVLRYKYSEDIADLENALPHMEESLTSFEKLVELTKYTYIYANSMQTTMRRIPITGRDGKNKTWAEMLPHYREELDNFRRNIEMLKKAELDGTTHALSQKAFAQANVEMVDSNIPVFTLTPGEKVYDDRDFVLENMAPELQNLTAYRFSQKKQLDEGTTLRFRNDKDVRLVVGYFNGHSYTLMLPPTLETNAQANDRGQADIKIANALSIPGMWPVNIYTYDFEPGNHTLDLGKGLVLILGFIDGQQDIVPRDAGITAKGTEKVIDWLFY